MPGKKGSCREKQPNNNPTGNNIVATVRSAWMGAGKRSLGSWDSEGEIGHQKEISRKDAKSAKFYGNFRILCGLCGFARES
jgi:hypothetical protein